MNYYYNNVPEVGLCRNNLIYTSLISDDKKTFCQWYYNDENYHGGHNEVVDASLMEEKWEREVKYLKLMEKYYPQHIPNILDIDHKNKKIFLEIEDVDFWELSQCSQNNYSKVLDNWQEQMLEILETHRKLNLYKYSLHPSSYFIVDNKLKSFNYFFAYSIEDQKIKVQDVLSHISLSRRSELFKMMEYRGINLNSFYDFKTFQLLAFDSFSNNYPKEFIDKAKKIYE